MSATVQLIRWRGERARAGPWRGDERVAYLAPTSSGRPVTPAFVRRCLDELARDGFSSVVTSAIAPHEAPGFLAMGFEVTERLHLLAHDLRDLPPHAPRHLVLHRARRADRPAVLTVDHAAFPSFWRMDGAGLNDALAATPRRRFRTATAPDGGQPVGYAITGRSRSQGFVQRVAVVPAYQGRGVGRSLTLDGLVWLHRRRAQRALVNTQVDNTAALALYEGLGFRRLPGGLSVLSAEL